MAEQLLDRIRAEIRERLRASEAAVREYQVLEAALAALGGTQVTSEPSQRRASKRSTPKRSAATTSPKRAPRGANRAAVLQVLQERPGVSVAELAQAADVTKPVLYNLLKTLEERGEVIKEQLPSGTTGYRRSAEVPSS